MSRAALIDLSVPTALAAIAAAVLLAQGARPGAAFGMLVATAALLGASVLGLFRAARALLGAVGEGAVEIGARNRGELAREKTLTLRSLKDLEFDHAMGKLSDRDFEEMGGRLRARAVRIMKDLDERPDYAGRIERELDARLGAADAPVAPVCASCGAANDSDATFCKRCGQRLHSS